MMIVRYSWRSIQRIFGMVCIFIFLSVNAVQTAPPAQAATSSSPYPPSPVISGISFDWSTHVRMANGSDNWPVTWAADDHQYTTWGDGGGFGGSNQDGRVSLGVARIEGSAGSYRGVNVWGGKDALQPAQFTGKSYGIAAVDGSLYMWRCGDGSLATAYLFQRLYRSTNQGQSWQETGVEYTQSSFSGSRGFYCPTFLQYGKDYQGARDGYVYMYAPELKSSSWEVQKPGEITLMRVPRSGLSSRSQYEYFAGLDGGGKPGLDRGYERAQAGLSGPGERGHDGVGKLQPWAGTIFPDHGTYGRDAGKYRHLRCA
jgi:hypothetical protein